MTAEEFSKNFTTGKSEETTGEYIQSMLTKFAQYHVEKALENVKLKIQLSFIPYDEESWNQKSIERKDILDFYDDGEDDTDFQYEQLRNRDGFIIEADEESIINAYPLTNIK